MRYSCVDLGMHVSSEEVFSLWLGLMRLIMSKIKFVFGLFTFGVPNYSVADSMPISMSYNKFNHECHTIAQNTTHSYQLDQF